jgi:hypothetical protein
MSNIKFQNFLTFLFPGSSTSSGSSYGGDHSRVLFYQSSNFEETLEAGNILQSFV